MSYNDKEITFENAKAVTELYLRNLTGDQSDYLKKLQVRFQEVRCPEAVRRALFTYLELEERCKKERTEKEELQRKLAELQANFNQFKRKVSSHFELEANLLLSRDALLDVISEPSKSHAIFKLIHS